MRILFYVLSAPFAVNAIDVYWVIIAVAVAVNDVF
jgi:hypothetical protein